MDPSAREREKKGTWVRDKTLGAGGFGTVALWRNEVPVINNKHKQNINKGIFI